MCEWPKGRFWCFCKTSSTLKGIGWKGFKPRWSVLRVAQVEFRGKEFQDQGSAIKSVAMCVFAQDLNLAALEDGAAPSDGPQTSMTARQLLFEQRRGRFYGELTPVEG